MLSSGLFLGVISVRCGWIPLKAHLMIDSRPDRDHSVMGHSFLLALHQPAPVFDRRHSLCFKESGGKETGSYR